MELCANIISRSLAQKQKSDKNKYSSFSIFVSLHLFAGEQTQGTVCIASVEPSNMASKSLANPSGGGRVFAFSIQIDSDQKVVVSSKKPISIKGLQINTKHSVKIFNENKVTESFTFTFEKLESQNLCLWFNSLYETWSLWPAKDGGNKCDCK